jgi:hypothetical protein
MRQSYAKEAQAGNWSDNGVKPFAGDFQKSQLRKLNSTLKGKQQGARELW